MSNLPNAHSREEILLKAIAESQAIDSPDPKSRVEIYLKQIMENGSISPEEIQAAVDAYLAEHPLDMDASLVDPLKAAPAGVVGERLSELKGDLDEIQKEFSYEYSSNIFDKETMTRNVAINTSGALFNDTTNTKSTTDFIPVNSGEKYGVFAFTENSKVTPSTYRIYGYDADKRPTAAYPNLSYSTSNVGNFTINDGDKYIRVAMQNAIFDGYNVMICRTDGISFPTYEEYKQTTLLSYCDYARTADIDALKKKKFTGLKWAIIGDSYSDASVLTYADYRYFNWIAEKTGIVVSQNLAKAGSGYKRLEDDGTNEHSFPQQANLIDADTDIVTVFGGGNDCSQDYAIGDYNDTTSTTTLCGAMNATISRIYNHAPNAKIIMFAPTPWSAYYPYASDEGGKMKELTEALRKVCEYRGIQYVDLFHCTGLRPQNATFRAEYYYDTVHPNNKGHKWLYPFILDAMKRALPTV